MLVGGIYMAHNKLLPQQFLLGKEGHKCLMKDLLMLIAFKIIMSVNFFVFFWWLGFSFFFLLLVVLVLK